MTHTARDAPRDILTRRPAGHTKGCDEQHNRRQCYWTDRDWSIRLSAPINQVVKQRLGSRAVGLPRFDSGCTRFSRLCRCHDCLWQRTAGIQCNPRPHAVVHPSRFERKCFCWIHDLQQSVPYTYRAIHEILCILVCLW